MVVAIPKEGGSEMGQERVVGKVLMAVCLALCLGLPLLSPSAAPAGTIVLKLAHVDPADTWTSRKGGGSTLFKQIVEIETRGAVEVQVFPAGQLGGEREMTEAVKFGTIQMTMISGALANFYKEYQVLDIPYLFSSPPVAWKVMDGWFGKEMAEDCLKKTGMRVLGFGEAGYRNFTNSVRPLRAPADFKGLKIRVMESPVYVALVKSLGAAPTPIAWTETYTALQQKVVDGQENPVSTIKYAKLNEVQKYLTLDGHTYGIDFILINDKFYQSLPKDIQKTIRTAAATTVTIMRGIQTIDSTLGVQQLREKGMEVYAPSDSEKALFRDAAQQPVVEYLEKQIGRPWIDKLQKAIKEAEAEMGG
jgi:tripartite ATP-independent transporter DctP family solute receptor